VCAIGNAADGQPLRTAMFPGQAAEGDPVAADQSYLLRTSGGRSYLVWSNHAYEVPDQWLSALGLTGAKALPVGDDFIAALPAGQQIAPPEFAGLGQPGPALPGSVDPVTVGSIFADRVNSYYVMTQDGLAALTPLQANLLLADPALAQAYGGSNPSPLPISQAQVTDAVLVPLPDLGLGEGAPAAAPGVATFPAGEQQLCVRYTDQVPEIVVGPADPTVTSAAGPVQLATGSGALVAARPNPDTPGTTVYLVTDTGVRYPVAGQRTLDQLGLAGVSVAQLPATVVGLLPAGPLLDPAAAATPAV
jgi:hypothetical protein